LRIFEISTFVNSSLYVFSILKFFLSLMMLLADYYKLLGLSSTADLADLKKAFREKAKLFHPDLNSAPHAKESFIRIHTAYEIVLTYLEGKKNPQQFYDAAEELERKKRDAAERAQQYARMKYEKYVKECEAYKQYPYNWIFRILYYGLFYIYCFCAMLFIFVPIAAGWQGGIFYFLICTPLFVLAYFTILMAMGWKKEIDPLFS
jgi:hypothetical protein